jgi:hypothetical protein
VGFHRPSQKWLRGILRPCQGATTVQPLAIRWRRYRAATGYLPSRLRRERDGSNLNVFKIAFSHPIGGMNPDHFDYRTGDDREPLAAPD